METEGQDLFKRDVLLLLAEDLPNGFCRLLKLLVVLLLKLDVGVAFKIIKGDRDHEERQHGEPLQPELAP